MRTDDHMLLTLSQPAKAEFDYKAPHEFPPSLPPSSKYFSPKLESDHSRSLLDSARSTMSNPHRGLPPPSAITLPDPGRGPPTSLGPSLGQMPAPPTQWQGAEDSMRNWLAAKAEEDKRRQEEEKTRQESLRLEQRKIEQAMLRDSMQGGIPPHLVPMIFAGIGGANLANVSAEWLQGYAAQLQAAQQQQIPLQPQTQHSPESRRETRMISQPAGYVAPQVVPQGVPAGSPIPGQPMSAQPQPSSAYPAYGAPMSPSTRARMPPGPGPTSAPRQTTHAQLPRLTTNEMQIHQPGTAPSGPHSAHATQQQQEASSPSIYFHHWVPPTSQSGSSKDNPPATPSGKRQNRSDSPY
ncbi:hypothetical protein K402DRAFT_432146 [Aulographum hederae CBS 113979]|uniref:Uncharacterized protein n=1 Tax=Aulographum hederae CBS 113979 TaxID=1176131 RepID=A0A6G1GY17_9PEZI|nr:hypothetical protein K402DRAFT_432146 [Aulographum hederae CBS 113979]